MSECPFTAPDISIEGQGFWDAAIEGRFVIKACIPCDRAFWYPRAICPFCLSDQTEFRGASGEGSIYSFTVMRAKPSYVVALVTLDEGPTMLTNIVDADFDAVQIGDRVRVRFKPSDGGPPVPAFAPTG
jgi:uncharacterized OB-fold protein